MRDKIKKLKALGLVLMFSASLLSGCTSAPEQTELSERDEQSMDSVSEYAENFVTGLDGLTDEEIASLADTAEELEQPILVNGFTTWLNTKDELGGLLGITESVTEKSGDREYRTVVSAEYEKRNCEFSIGMERTADGGQTVLQVSEISISPEYSTGELMAQAFGNMVVGMGTVFAVLIFIALIISLFKYLPNPEAEKKKVKPAEAENSGLKELSEKPLAEASDSDVSEEELTAVIAAAIAAYESETKGPKAENGLIVRSIKRVPNVMRKR